jgi:nicotinamidase-related amidase
MSISIDPKRTAILALDFENDIVGGTADIEPVLDNARQILEAGRTRQIPVIYIKVSFAGEYSDAPPKSPLFQMVRKKGILRGGTTGTEIHERMRPQPGEMVLNKTCINPFLTTNLQQRLVALGVDTVIVMGLWTNFAVESTVRHASDIGYGVIVVADACGSNTRENHDYTVQNILPMFAAMSQTNDILQELGVQPKPFRKNTLYDERELAARGATVQRVVVKAGGRVDVHTHQKTTEVYCLVRGNAKLAIGDKEYAAIPGSVFMARPGEPHSLENIGDDDVEMVMFTTNQEASDIYTN